MNETMKDMQGYCLESSQDKRDRTEEIRTMLQEKGVCVLGAGVFYVSGIRMPDHTALMGMGPATRLLLDPALESGFAVQVGSFCTVNDLFVTGAAESIEHPDRVGERHGLLFCGTATTKDWHDQPRNSVIEGCHIESFTGGGITCVDTGYYICSALTVSNCHILRCGAAINISHFSEYHEFTNVLCSESLYGCINNGGNNVFVNCGFNANVVGFLMDNAKGQSPNNSHGSVVGCTFNHSDDNKGIGIMALGAQHGYVFSGCQMFYSRIVLEDSCGILFDAMNFSRNMDIAIKGGKLVMLTNSVFHGAPTFTVSEGACVKVLHCYTREGEEIHI